MVKTVQPKKVIKPQVNQKPEKPYKPLIPEKYQDFVFIGIIVVSIFIFFWDAVFGGGFNVSDNIASVSFRPFVEQARKDGEFPLWIPYIFCGMPDYGSLLLTGDRWWDLFAKFYTGATVFVGSLFNNDTARMVCFYIIYGIGMYYLMISKDHKKIVAFWTAMGAVFSTGVVIWIMIGHNTKPMVFAMFPFIFLLLEKLREKFSLLYTVLLILAAHLMLEAGHLQMMFYGICAFALYLVVEYFERLIKKDKPMTMLRPTAILILAGCLAFIMSADRYLTTLEYTPQSTRGSTPLVKSQGKDVDQKDGGHDYSYATMWSFSPEEMVTFIIPNYFGFGRMEYKGELTNGKPYMLPTYWGQKPFEDAAPYMGIGIFALALLGAWANRKNIFIKFLIILSLFALLLSFGSTLPVLYNLFYYYIPSFNKFRAPSMSLALMQFAFPIMAGYGLSSVLSWRNNFNAQQKKYIIIMIVSSIVFLLIGFAYNGAFKTGYIESVAASAQGSRFPEQIHNFIYDQMISDWYVTGLIAVAFSFLIYFYLKNKLNNGIFFTAMVVLLVIDLWRVDYRRMEVSKTVIEKEYFSETDVVKYLKHDKSLFRIADYASESPNIAAYFFLENVNGYHSAKLRVFQDLLDVADRASTSDVTNPFLLSLMNVKYIIRDKPIEGFEPTFQSQQKNGGSVYINKNVLPRAFFVKNAEKSDKMTILNKLKEGSFNPMEVAYVEDNLPIKLDTPDSTCAVNFAEHKNQYLKVDVKASGNNLLFMSEVYYPVSWHAYLDGKEIPIYKTDFAFRSVIIPQGKHTLEMRFISEKFLLGKNLSLISNLLVLLTGLVAVVMVFISKKKKAIA